MSLVREYQNHSRTHPNPDPFKAALFDVINDLRGRSGGIDDMIGNIDSDTLEELLETNLRHITSNLKG